MKKGGRDRGKLIRIIGSKAQDEISHWSHHEGIPPHRHRGECLVANVLACIFVRACNGLESVAVEMEGMFACVIVVEDDFYDVVML